MLLILYVISCTALIGLSALVVERGFSLLRLPRRWVWVAALFLSLAIPVLNVAVNKSVSAPNIEADKQARLPYNPIPSPSLIRQIEQAQSARYVFPSAFKNLWFVGSLTVLSFYGVGWLRLRAIQRRWIPERVGSVPVYVTDDMGPGVVGFINPKIILPRWLSSLPGQTCALAFAHERSHLEARDPALWLAALLWLAIIPWNPLLWWQLRRLRMAIEVDCDARIVPHEATVSAYGEALYAIAQRKASLPLGAMALIENASQLERRIRILVAGTYRNAKLVVSGHFAAMIILMAGMLSLNVDLVAAATASKVKVDIERLNKYVGTYQLAPDVFVTVTREQDGLFIARSGMPTIELVPQNETTFAYKYLPMTITFSVPGEANSDSLTLHKNINEHQLALRVDNTLAQAREKAALERVRNQKPATGGEQALRQQILAAQAGKPAYEAMTANLEARVRQIPTALIQETLAPLGELNSLKFVRVNNTGADIYYGTFANGAAVWELVMAENGRLEHMEFLNLVVERTSDAQTLYSKTMNGCQRCGD